MGGAGLPGASPAARRHWPTAPRAPAHWPHRPSRASRLAVAARPGIRVRWPQSGSARCPRRGGRSPSLTSSIPQVTLRFATAGPPHRASGRGGPFPAAPRRRRGPRWRLPNSEPLSIRAEAAGHACALGAARRSARLGATAGAAVRMRGGDSGLGGCGGSTGKGTGLGGAAPSRGSRSRPALHCRPAHPTPPPRCLCSPLAMCGAPGFEVRVPPTACWSPLPPQPRAGVGVTSLLRLLGSGSVCHLASGLWGPSWQPRQWGCGRVAVSPGWARLPGQFGGRAGTEGGRVSCPRWVWWFFWERFGQSALREMP